MEEILTEPPVEISSYARIDPINEYIKPQKQAAKRHYGSHQYFTKRAWNVVQAYIKRFTKAGDVVCDPFGGSGVTIIEALVLGRKGIYLDISDWAGFLAEQVALSPVTLSDITDAFDKVERSCSKIINDLQSMEKEDIERLPLTRWYPQGQPLPKNADAKCVEDLFTRRQLLQLSELCYQISRIKDSVTRNLLRYAFSATLYKCNRTFISAKGRKESRGGSAIFSVFRYKTAKTVIELNPWDVFKRAVSKLLQAKMETNSEIGRHEGGSNNAVFLKGYAQSLTEQVSLESVDYIFTDPPYGALIPYLDLTRMWDAWLGFFTTEKDREEEAIENGDAKHSPEHYKRKLSDSISQMFKVLKYDRWMSIVFAHRSPAMWDMIVKSAETAGFEYVNTVPQPLDVVWSMHKKKNPLTVLSGELILNFRKVRNPRTLAISSVGGGAINLIKDSAELSIVQKGGATVDQIYNDLIPKLLETGMLGEVSGKIGDIGPILRDTFDYDEDTSTYQVRPGKKLGCHIPMRQRIRFYVVDYLNQTERLGKRATFDDIVFHVLPKLKNGEQPTEQSVGEELKKIARPIQGKYWERWDSPQMVFDFAKDNTGAKSAIGQVPRRAESDYKHNEILVILASLAKKAGFKVFIGKKEQSSELHGVKLADLSQKTLSFLHGASAFTKSKVEQIDLIWIDSKRPSLSFEIEHSTSITSGLDRFLELLKVDQDSAERLLIVAPKRRKRKLDQVLGMSHYIGAPMYLDKKVRYLWYSDILDIEDRFRVQNPTKSTLADAILQAAHSPKVNVT